MTKLNEVLEALNLGEAVKNIANETVAKAVQAHEAASKDFLDKMVVLHDAYSCDSNAPEDKVMELLVSCASLSVESGPSTFLSLTLPSSVGGSEGDSKETNIEWQCNKKLGCGHGRSCRPAQGLHS